MGSCSRLGALFLPPFFFLLAASATVAGPSTPIEEHQIMEQGDLKAFVPAMGWCMEVVHSIVRAPTAEPFNDDRIGVQRMIGHLRIALSMECPQATTILVDGFGADQHVYTGMASQASGWVLEETTPPALADTAAECNTLAAHPDDPEKEIDGGVPDEDINADMAVEACKDALDEHPNDPLYQFQVGRAYWANQRYDEAIESFVLAAEQDHGGALAYLGDAVLYGVADLDPDPGFAKLLYTRAAEEGFEPAAALADEIEVDPKPDDEDGSISEIAQDGSEPVVPSTAQPNRAREQVQVAKESMDLKKSFESKYATIIPPDEEAEYAFPKLIAALSSGNVNPEGVWVGRMLVYSISTMTSVVDRCPELKPQGFEPKEGFLRAMNMKLNYTEKLVLSESYEKGNLAELQEGASRDGAKLVETKGCTARETKTLVKTVTTHYGAG
nr:hypothetical protein [Nitrosomonas nitrosa]